MRRSYENRKLARRNRRPAELLLVPMIDIFTVLVTFLLMTAVFSRTVVLQVDLPTHRRRCRNCQGSAAGGAGAPQPARGGRSEYRTVEGFAEYGPGL